MQPQNISQNTPFEIIEVTSLEVACDGGPENQKLGLGHPKVYLHIDADKGEITCPYCSRQYVLRAGTHHGNH
jgi:uncharacterized Zn-finger protein